jgi:uncharacterized protein (TIGR02118 family)
MVTAMTFLKRTPGLDDVSFDRHWSGPHADLVRRLPGLSAYTQAPLHPDARRPQPFDGLALAEFVDLDALRAAAASAAYADVQDDEAHFIDGASLVTLVVERHVVQVPSPQPTAAGSVMFVGVMHRRPDLDRSAFLAHWRGPHADRAARLPGLQRYVHHVPVPLRGEPVYDGVALLWFSSIADLLTAFRSEAGRVVRSDESKFVDGNRSFALMLCERPIL